MVRLTTLLAASDSVYLLQARDVRRLTEEADARRSSEIGAAKDAASRQLRDTQS